MSNEPLCVGKFQTTRHGALTVVTCGKPKHDRVHNTEGPFPPGPPPCPGINLHDFREFPPIARGWEPYFHQKCDQCGMPSAWGHTGNGWTSYLCMNCYDAMKERLLQSRTRVLREAAENAAAIAEGDAADEMDADDAFGAIARTLRGGLAASSHEHPDVWWTAHESRDCCKPCCGEESPNPDSDIARDIHVLKRKDDGFDVWLRHYMDYERRYQGEFVAGDLRAAWTAAKGGRS